jgi:hypothetical protein
MISFNPHGPKHTVLPFMELSVSVPQGIPSGLGNSSIDDSGRQSTRLVDDSGGSDNGIGATTGCQISTFQPTHRSLCGTTFAIKPRITGPRSAHELAARKQLI